MEKNKHQDTIDSVKSTFIETYPNTTEKFKKDIMCFISFCVTETIKEIENRNQ